MEPAIRLKKVIFLIIPLAMIFNGCSGDERNPHDGSYDADNSYRSSYDADNFYDSAYTPVGATRKISEGFTVISSSNVSEITDIGIHESGLLYVAGRDRVIIITPQHEEKAWVDGLDDCGNIAVCRDRILALDQGNGNILLKTYGSEGALLAEVKLQAEVNIVNIIKMEPLDKSGEKLALLASDSMGGTMIFILDVKSGRINRLDFSGTTGPSDIVCFCSCEEDRLFIGTQETSFKALMYDISKGKVLNEFSLEFPFADASYNAKDKKNYYVNPSQVGYIKMDSGAVQTINRLEDGDRLYTRIETHNDL